MAIPSFRDRKLKARRDLHEKMLVPAFYIPVTGADPVPCNVRVWTKWQALGQTSGNREKWAELEDISPSILFMVSEVPFPKQNGIVSVAPGEAYRIGPTNQRDGISVTSNVTQIPSNDSILSTLPVPVADDG